ncbi:TPA: exodeoxyribonuclease VII small subunit [Candidatus Acetothermia bacterium]|nr:exodeoxyribonuclease VII small subunit [Candidatus Acetothermia bacterium]
MAGEGGNRELKIDETLRKLEEITKHLEEEDLPLEDALSLFEEGIALAAKIKTELDQAKLKIQQVIEKAKDVFSLKDFDLQ